MSSYPTVLIFRNKYGGDIGVKRYTIRFRNKWERILAEENRLQQQLNNNLRKSSIIAFGSSSTFPKDIAKHISSFVKFPISETTLSKVSDIAVHRQKWEILVNGRGGEGLHLPLCIHPNPKKWLRENQQPRLCFSQPEFRKQIRKNAHRILFHQLKTHGDIQTQLSTFITILLTQHT